MLIKLKQEQFDSLFEIMQESFPSDEYRTYDEQKKLLYNPIYTIYTLCNQTEDDLKAFIAVYEFEKFVFVEHLAVKSSCRNQRLGAILLKELQLKTDKTICLEVEPPQTEMAKRRIGFYQRNGFVFNNYNYIQPAISKGKKPIPLFIMSSKKELVEQDFQQIKDIIYAEVYGQKNI